MIVTVSDSTETLMSHNNDKDDSVMSISSPPAPASIQYKCTALYLSDCSSVCDDKKEHGGAPSCQSSSHLYLPIRDYSLGGPSVDNILAGLPSITSRCHDLLSRPAKHFHQHSTERILYVAQGEIAHAVPSQCDVLISDKATTCHILALRSVSSQAVPLCTLTHIDCIRYKSCIINLLDRHKQHHEQQRAYCKQNCYKSVYDEETSKLHVQDEIKVYPKIKVDIHIMGGFNDSKNTSSDISNWLVHLLADCACCYADSMHLTLQTCAISSLNDDGQKRPVGRGLALDLQSGNVFLASCHVKVAGPCLTLRSARVTSKQWHILRCIHDERTDEFYIPAFRYAPHYNTAFLLKLRDSQLLQCSSTSPDCEEDDFCDQLRTTLTFMQYVPYYMVFGRSCAHKLEFQRIDQSNDWQALLSTNRKHNELVKLIQYL